MEVLVSFGEFFKFGYRFIKKHVAERAGNKKEII